MRKVKIVCTLGPATAGVPRLLELIEAGMDVARLNFSHVTTTPTARPTTSARGGPPGRPAHHSVRGPLWPKIRVGRMTNVRCPWKRERPSA